MLLATTSWCNAQGDFFTAVFLQQIILSGAWSQLATWSQWKVDLYALLVLIVFVLTELKKEDKWYAWPVLFSWSHQNQVCLALSVVEWELRQVYLLGTGFTIFFGEFFHNSENFVSRKFVTFCISGQETAPPVEEKFTHEISSGSEHVRFTMMQI